MTAYNKWEDKCKKELEFLSSREGEELQLCLVAQGYEVLLFSRWMILLGSGFSAFEIIKQLEEKLK